MNQDYEIRKLKNEIEDLRLLCQTAGVPILITYLPKLVITNKKPTKEQVKWAKDKIKEYEKQFTKNK